MKNLSMLSVVPFAMLAAAGLALASQKGSGSCCSMAMQHDDHHSAKAFQAKQLKDKQTAAVTVDNGYSPALIEVREGKPVELTFTGGKNIGCGGTVVFKSLGITKEIATGKSAVVKFTPKKKGKIAFSCSMGMLQGTVIVK